MQKILRLDTYQLSSLISMLIGSLILINLALVSLETVAKLAYLRLILPRQILSQFDLGIGQLYFRAVVKSTLPLTRKLLLQSVVILFACSIFINYAFIFTSNIVRFPIIYIFLLAAIAPVKHLTGEYLRALNDFRILSVGNWSMMAVNICLYLFCLEILSIYKMALLIIFIEVMLAIYCILVARKKIIFLNNQAKIPKELITEFKACVQGNLVSNFNGYFMNLLFVHNLSEAAFGLVSLVQRFRGLITTISVIFLKKIETILYQHPQRMFRNINLKEYNQRLNITFVFSSVILLATLYFGGNSKEVSVVLIGLIVLVLVFEYIWRIVSPKKILLTFSTDIHKKITNYISLIYIGLYFLVVGVFYVLPEYNEYIALIYFCLISFIPVILINILYIRHVIVKIKPDN